MVIQMPISHDPTKPLMRLRCFAQSLGWRGLEMWQHLLEPDKLVTWYQTSDQKFFLHITEYPVGQTSTYAAAVYASRYSICTGFHTFELSEAPANNELHYWLAREQFRDRKARRNFCERHPECCFAKRKRRPWLSNSSGTRWPPFFPGDVKPPVCRQVSARFTGEKNMPNNAM